MSKLYDHTQLPTLVAILSDTKEDSDFRTRIASLLGRTGDQAASKSLLSLFENTHIETNIRSAIARAIGMLGDASMLPILLTYLENAELFFAEACIDAITHMKDRSVIPRLKALLSGPQLSSELRLSITQALLELGERITLKQFLTILAERGVFFLDDGDGFTKAFIKHSDQTTYNELLELLVDNQLAKEIRIEIARAFGTCKDPSVIPALQRLRDNTSLPLSLQDEIVITLGRLGDHSVAQKLLHITTERGPSYWHHATDALIECLAPSQLIELLTNPTIKSDIRHRITIELADKVDASIVPALLPILTNDTMVKKVRRGVAYMIEQLAEDEQTVHVLLDLWQKEPKESDLHYALYDAMWSVGRRAGVTVIPTGPGGTVYKVVPR